MSVFNHCEFDAHEHVAYYRDEKCGLSAIIAIHNTNLGASIGGCRMWPYKAEDEALSDVLRLSKGMTYKAAIAGLSQGGGKAVIIGDPLTDKTPEMMISMGKFINSLSGKYVSAEDSGMSVADLKIVNKETNYVAGVEAKYYLDSSTRDGNPAPSTAYGVFVGIKASVNYAMGRDLRGTKVAIQGLGHVGMRLAAHLYKAGVTLYVTDIVKQNIDEAVRKYAAVAVSPSDIESIDVDVFAPCGMGGTLNVNSISRLKAKVVAGAANNQLAKEEYGELLREKGILYAPDFVINGGGIIDIHHQSVNSSIDLLKSHIENIASTLLKIYEKSNIDTVATNTVANLLAEKRFVK